MQIVILTFLSLISISTILSTHRAIRAIRRFRLLPQGLITSSESIHHIGYSIICSSVYSIKHIEELLSIEYDRYEVIVVIDSKKHKKAFEQIVSYYHLIEVSNPPCRELPAASIRRLYRSGLRSLRRVVLIDRLQISEYDDLSAAATIASYDRLIPIGEEDHLYPNAIELITATISEKIAQNHKVELLYSPIMARGYIFSREQIIEAGGFSAHVTRNIPAKNQFRLDIPICYRDPSARTLLRVAPISMLIIATTSLFIFGALPTMALISTITLQWLCTRYISDYFCSKICSTRSLLYYLSLKWDFFNTRKFTVS